MKLTSKQLKQGFIQGHIYSKGDANSVSLNLVYYHYCKKYNVHYSDILNWDCINQDFESYKEAQKFYDAITAKYDLKLQG